MIVRLHAFRHMFSIAPDDTDKYLYRGYFGNMFRVCHRIGVVVRRYQWRQTDELRVRSFTVRKDITWVSKKSSSPFMLIIYPSWMNRSLCVGYLASSLDLRRALYR